MPSDDLLRPDNHDLFDLVRMMLVSRDPVISLEDIAAEFGVEVNELIEWFLAYRVPRSPSVLPVPVGFQFIRDPELRAEHARLRRRERDLVTLATEAPEQLERVQRRIGSLERSH